MIKRGGRIEGHYLIIDSGHIDMIELFREIPLSADRLPISIKCC